MPTTATIDDVLDAFLSDQRGRLSARTMRSYEDVIDLLRDSLNGYGPNSLDGQDLQRWKQAMDAGDDEAFCRLLGPEYIIDHIGEFLGYFMVRKVIAGQSLLRASGTVTKALATWLHEHGYTGEAARDHALDRGTEAARDLPRAERLANLLYEQSLAASGIDRRRLGPGDTAGGDLPLQIERVEPGRLFFTGGVGPLPVSQEASELARPGWEVTITLARLHGTWQVTEVGNVYPR
jgi:hypothetical protein